MVGLKICLGEEAAENFIGGICNLLAREIAVAKVGNDRSEAILRYTQAIEALTHSTEAPRR